MSGKRDTQRRKAHRLAADGLSLREIGEELGVGKSTVARWLDSPAPAIPAKAQAMVAAASVPEPGNRRAVSHGAYAAVLADRLADKEAVIYRALSADAPLRSVEGELPKHDAVQVSLLATCLCRLDTVGEYLAEHGLMDRKGNVRPAVDLERHLRKEAATYLDAMGMSPRSRAALGVDLSALPDLARQWAIQGVATDG